jgi:hypothetical protein
MTSIYKEQQECFRHLDKLVGSLPKGGMNKSLLIIQLQNNFAVSEKAILKRLTRYEEAGLVLETEGLIKPL